MPEDLCQISKLGEQRCHWQQQLHFQHYLKDPIQYLLPAMKTEMNV